MKKLLSVALVLVLALSFVPTTAFATPKTIYVSAEYGSDSGNGTQTRPYATIGKARNYASPGDTIEVGEGIYYERLVFWENDGTNENPHTIKGATGAEPIICTYEPVNSDWTLYKNNIYKTNIGVKYDLAHAVVLQNDEFANLVEARWPNAPADDVLKQERGIMDKGSDHYGIVDDALPQGNFVGATAYVWTGKVYEQYLSYSGIVSEYTPGESLKFSGYVGEDYDTYTPQKGDWYYLTNCLDALDTYSEYYYDKTTGDLYIMMPDGKAPKKGEVHVQTRDNADDNDNAIELWGSDYIRFENLTLMGGGVVVHDSNHNTFDDVNVYYSDIFRTNNGYNTHVNAYNSVRFCGDYNTFINSEIAYTMSSGLLINGDGNRVENCDIHDVALGGGYNGCISIEGGATQTTITHNNLYKSGRFLIYFINTGIPGDGYADTVIEYNDCYEAMYLTSDGGAIYGYHRNGKGVVIQNNWVHDSDNSCGIYLDNECENFVVRNNVVWNVSQSGIVLNTNSINNTIYRNTVYECGEGIQGWPKTSEYSQKGTIVANNAVLNNADFITGENAPTLIANISNAELYLDKYFVPQENSPCLDAGVLVSGIDDKAVGSSIDVGAYEVGGDYWIAGTYDKTLVGDANFDNTIDLKDMLVIRKRLANKLVTVNPTAADVNKNGEVDAEDLLKYRMYFVNKISNF